MYVSQYCIFSTHIIRKYKITSNKDENNYLYVKRKQNSTWEDFKSPISTFLLWCKTIAWKDNLIAWVIISFYTEIMHCSDQRGELVRNVYQEAMAHYEIKTLT